MSNLEKVTQSLVSKGIKVIKVNERLQDIQVRKGDLSKATGIKNEIDTTITIKCAY